MKNGGIKMEEQNGGVNKMVKNILWMLTILAFFMTGGYLLTTTLV